MTINIYNKDLHLENIFVLLSELNDNKKMIHHCKQSIYGDVSLFQSQTRLGVCFSEVSGFWDLLPAFQNNTWFYEKISRISRINNSQMKKIKEEALRVGKVSQKIWKGIIIWSAKVSPESFSQSHTGFSFVKPLKRFHLTKWYFYLVKR